MTLLAVASSRATFAQQSNAAPPDEPDSRDEREGGELTPRLHHAPPAVVTAAEDVVLTARIAHPELVQRAVVLFRSSAAAPAGEVTFQRSYSGYVAVIPAARVRWPWLTYTIELELRDGKRVSVFASRQKPHAIQVPEDRMDVRERALLRRLSGRRSVVSSSAEYVTFGESLADVRSPSGELSEQKVDDRYYRLEAAYTYRPLRFVTEFSLRMGVVRGRSPVPVERAEGADTSSPSRFDVGLNYAAPTLLLRMSDAWHLQGSFLTSVTEVGFSVGGGGAVLIGDPYGSKLTVGFETIDVFGSRFYSRMDLVTASRWSVSPIVEISNMPHAEIYGVRLLGELGFDLGSGFGVLVRGGYQARLATSGGPGGGAALSYAF